MINKYSKELVEILTNVSDVALMSRVLSNLLTPQEIEEVALRVQIIKGLKAGQNQRELADRLGVSLGTISRGSRELQYGEKGISEVLDNDV
jgi:TrpR family trp operon transcriptional repressor